MLLCPWRVCRARGLLELRGRPVGASRADGRERTFEGVRRLTQRIELARCIGLIDPPHQPRSVGLEDRDQLAHQPPIAARPLEQ